uniref:hypothetical protein n=1 Tax=Aliarcobacter sp. TaxID=2321116 RepID=UPI004048B4C1
MDKVHFKRYYSVAAVVQDKLNDADYSATIGADPVKMAMFHFNYSNVDNTSDIDIYVLTHFTFYCKFY